MRRARTASLLGATLALSALFAFSATAIARQGSDDPPGDDRGGQRSPSSDDSNSAGSDDRARGDRREIRKAGRCTGSSTSKIKVKTEDGNRIELEFEVDQNRNGRRWGVAVRRNGATVLRRAYRTKAPSGSFEARKRVRDRSGTDRFVAIARNPRTGERCIARVAF